MIIKTDEYIAMESAKLPYKTAWDFVVQKLDVICPDCNQQVRDQKYRFNEFTNSLDIIAVGICDSCNCIVTSTPMRVYRDGRTLSQNANGQWVEGRMNEERWFHRLKNKWQSWRKRS